MLPFALVDEMGWFTVPVVTLVTFTLYSIDGIGIGSRLEDPFGYDRNDIKMDFIVEDIRSEIAALLEEWKRVEEEEEEEEEEEKEDQGEEMFIRPRRTTRRDGGGGGSGDSESLSSNGHLIELRQDALVAKTMVTTRSENLV